MSDPILSVKDQLAELFNESLLAQQGLETEYVVEDLTFAVPALYAPGVIDLTQPTSRNTSLLVSVEVPAEIEGDEPTVIQSNLHYNRLHVPVLISNFGGDVEGTGDEASTHDLLEALSAALGTELLAEDFEDEILDEVDAETYTCTLRATANSLGYFGEGTITIKFPAAAPPAGGDDGDGQA